MGAYRSDPGRASAGNILCALLAALLPAAPARAAATGTSPVRPRVEVSDEHVRDLHRRAVVVDTHADTLWRVLDKGDDITVRSAKGQVDIPRLLDGGVDGQFFSIWPQPIYGPGGYIKRCLRLIDALHGIIERSGGRMFLATEAQDIRRADREGKIAALLGIEGGHAIEDDLGALRMFYRMGVRYMTLTWSINTSWADSSGDKRTFHGLTAFGEKVVREMNRLGMLVDISHVSDETYYDVLKVTSAPVIASHSSCRALCGAPRNMTDEMLQALAKNGGVVMINYFSAFIDPNFRAASDAAEEKAKDRISAIASETLGDPVARENRMWEMYASLDGAIPPPSIDRVLDHIEHVIQVAGADHVGLGSDFDGITSAPAGLEDVSKVPAISRGLLERGHSDEEVIKILGGNFLRVFDRAGAIASGR